MVLYKAGIAQGMGLYGGREQLRHPTAPSTSRKQPAPCLASTGLATLGSPSSAGFISPSGGQHLPGLFARANLAAVFKMHLFFPSDCFFQSRLWEWKEMLNRKS